MSSIETLKKCPYWKNCKCAAFEASNMYCLRVNCQNKEVLRLREARNV